MDATTVRRVALVALEKGARVVSPTLIEWDAAGRCHTPKGVDLHGRPVRYPRAEHWRGHELREYRPGGPVPIWLRMEVPCRNCVACRGRRARMWRDRAMHEWRQACRTWLGTLTLTPAEHYRVLCQARAQAVARGWEFDRLDEDAVFGLRHECISRKLTLWLKRVRKETAAPFRYLLVAEKHKSGLPHYHVLIHESTFELPVRKEVLKRQWPYGFTRWKLVDSPEGAAYVCKYLSKDALARVRASEHYGTALAIETMAPHPGDPGTGSEAKGVRGVTERDNYDLAEKFLKDGVPTGGGKDFSED